MAVQFSIVTPQISLVAGTAKTVIEGIAGANHPPEWIEFIVSNMATSGFTVVELTTFAATGTGTAFTPLRRGTAVGSSESTWKVNDTVEPATQTTVWVTEFANPFTWDVQFPLGREHFHNVSSGMGIRLTSSVAATAGSTGARAALMIEE